jgi:hypothetical protein
MIRVDMSEGTAHFTFVAACGLATFAGGASIVLGMEEVPLGAAVFLSLALIGCFVTLFSYDRYTRRRNERWRRELMRAEDRLNQMFNHARMSLLVDQTVETPDEVTVEREDATGSQREGTVANS